MCITDIDQCKVDMRILGCTAEAERAINSFTHIRGEQTCIADIDQCRWTCASMMRAAPPRRGGPQRIFACVGVCVQTKLALPAHFKRVAEGVRRNEVQRDVAFFV